MDDLDDIDYDDDDESPSPAECCKKCCDSCCCCGAGRMRYLILVATLIVAMGWYGAEDAPRPAADAPRQDAAV